MKKTPKPTLADPFALTKDIMALIAVHETSFGGSSPAAQDRAAMLRTVMIVQAVNQLTEAVRENTATMHRVITIPGRIAPDGGVILNDD